MVVKAKTKAKPAAVKSKSKAAVTWPFPTPGIPEKKTNKKPAKPLPATDNKKHVVMASLNNVELAKARSALSLDLYADGKKIGNLEIGQGSFFWTGARKQKSKPINWSTFAAMMNHLAYEK